VLWAAHRLFFLPALGPLLLLHRCRLWLIVHRAT
jgi:hypothetical protein